MVPISTDPTTMQGSSGLRRRVVLCGALFVSLGPVSLGLFTPAMAVIANDMNVERGWVQASLIVYVLGFSLFQLVSGPLSDAFGRRLVLAAFIGIYLFGSIVGLCASSISLIIIGRLAQGIGAAAGVTVLRAIVRDLFAGQEAASVLSSIGTMLAVSPAIAPLIGAVTIEAVGWRGAFVVMSLVGAILLLVSILIVPETHPPSRRARLSVRYMSKMYLELMTTPRVLAAAVTAACSIGGIYMFAAFMPFVLMQHAGLTTLEFGVFMLFPSSLYTIGAYLTRRLLLRLDHQQLILPGLVMLCSASVSLGLVLLLGSTNAVAIIVPTAFFSFALSIITPAITVQAMEGRKETAGAAAAILGFFQFGGGFTFGIAGMALPSPVIAAAVLPVLMSITAILAQIVVARHRAPNVMEIT